MTAYSVARSDTLPDGARYEDTGCKVEPKCLTCSLPFCVEDQPSRLRDLINAKRDARIFELRKSGVPVRELTRAFGLGERTVHRIIQRGGPKPEVAADLERWPDAAGKPVDAIRSPFKQRAPLPRLPVGARV